MNIRVINSGSDGNGYTIGDEKETLLIEAGCNFKEVQKALNFNTFCIQGMVISHSHTDHYRYYGQFEHKGFPIFTPFSDDRMTAKMGRFAIQAFRVPHQEDLHCYGFLIKHPKFGKLLFMTDLEYCPYDLSKVNPDIVMVECNYMDEYVSADLRMEQKQRTDHKYSGHMSLDTCKTFLKTVLSDDLRNVILIHMSHETCDGDEAVRQVKEIVGKNVTVDIAYMGKTIDIGDWIL